MTDDEPKPIKPGHLYVPQEALTLEQYRALNLKRPLTDGPVGNHTGVKREQDHAASRVWDEDQNAPFTELMEASLEGARRRLGRQRRPKGQGIERKGRERRLRLVLSDETGPKVRMDHPNQESEPA